MSTKAEQACSFAALILADESISITPEKLQALLKTAGIDDVEPIWTTLFAKALGDKDVKDILTTAPASGLASGPVGEPQTKGDDGGDDKRADDEVECKDGEDDDSDSGEDLGNLFDL
ncbi:hypothetical protein K505DRAFT_322951 [Melanomma pulvis-pyrius CBS 109.77]|uniref:Large ribosomal subunit protein P1 n=1 Tax=Melanomma pulvis-pyrius CBS 109.77 TaxID=1314802 RepID=A0A6A6XL99_9PLEO|nr:hypothetical protein K505DRAFT_322951 [Melanomma pulvis-pyrius CBS 109.77]